MNGSQTQKTTACVLSHTHHKRRTSMAGPQCQSMQLAGLWAAASKASGFVKVSVSDDAVVSGDAAVSPRATGAQRSGYEHGLFNGQVTLRLAKLMFTKDLPGETGRQAKVVSM